MLTIFRSPKPLFILGLLSLTTFSFVDVSASSHREAPFIAKLPQVDATDFYMFTSYEPGREDYVTFIANYIPLHASYGGPNYFPLDAAAVYEISIDNDGDAVEDITFQFDFADVLPVGEVLSLDIDTESVTSVLRNIGGISAGDEPGLSHVQTYTLNMIDGDRSSGARSPVTNTESGSDTFRKPFDYSGEKTFGGPGNYGVYADSFIYDLDVPGCSGGRVFVGQRYEAFKIALGEVFDLVNFVPLEGGVSQDPSRNTLDENNVTSIALEVHKDCLGTSDVIGAWTAARLPQARVLNPAATFDKPRVSGGALTQVSRLSAPLVNELVIGYDQKDRFNSSHPVDDGQFATFVTNPVLPAILDTLFRDAVGAPGNIAPSNFPRTDLVAAFLTGFDGVNAFDGGTPSEMLRLNTAITPTVRADQQPLGLAAGDLAGFPNGRRPGDDVVDIALRVVMGALCYPLPLGDGGALVNLGFCDPDDAPVGNAPFTDGAPLSALDLNDRFPYLLTPYPGSPIGAPLPQPEGS